DQDSRALIVVLLDGFDNPLLLEKDLAEGFGLAVAEFHHDFSAWFEEWRAFGGQAAKKIQAIGAAVERLGRVVGADFALERLDFSGRDVGRVADDEVQPGLRWQGGKAVPQRKPGWTLS